MLTITLPRGIVQDLLKVVREVKATGFSTLYENINSPWLSIESVRRTFATALLDNGIQFFYFSPPDDMDGWTFHAGPSADFGAYAQLKEQGRAN